jgi:hypothetical protein
LDIAASVRAQKKELRHRVVKSSRLFFRKGAGLRWVPDVKEVTSRRSPETGEFLRVVSHNCFNILGHVYNYLSVTRVVQDHSEVVMDLPEVANDRDSLGVA